MRSMINKRHLEKENFARRFIDAFSDFFDFSGKEIICTMFLVASLTFLSTFIPLGQEIIQPPSLTDLPIIIERFGFPFESLRKIYTYHAAQMPETRMSGEMVDVMIPTVNVAVEWLGLIVNFMVYALPLIVIIKVVARVKDEIDYRRYDRK